MTRLLAAAAVSLCLLPLQAQQDPKVTITPRPKLTKPAASESCEGTIRVDSNLVLVPVTVTDPLNRFVAGLEKEHFRVFEDKVEVPVTHFASEDAPISLGIVFDTSGSMGSKLRQSRRAVTQLIRTGNPQDEFFLVTFSDRPELLVNFTKNGEDIQSRVTFTESKRNTALVDAVYLAVATMKKASNPRKALVIISDGGDNSSRYSNSELKNLVQEADVQIYAMGIFEPFSARSTPEEMSGPALLTGICEQTGGRHFDVDRLSEMPDIANKIAIELHNEYVLGYTPANQERDGKYRRVQVKMVQPRGMPALKARYRMGYYAPLR